MEAVQDSGRRQDPIKLAGLAQRCLDRLIIQDNLRVFKIFCRGYRTVDLISGETTAFALAVCLKSLKIFHWMLYHPSLSIDLVGGGNRSALTEAVIIYDRLKQRGEVAILYHYFIETLLKKGSTITTTNGPFFQACVLGSMELRQLLLSHGAKISFDTDNCTLPFDQAIPLLYSTKTVDMIFDLTYADVEPINLHIMTISNLIKNNRLSTLQRIIPRVSAIDLSSDFSIDYLVKQLYKLPFAMFEELVNKFSEIVEHLQTVDKPDLSNIIDCEDSVSYLRFLCKTCTKMTNFNATQLLSPDKVSYELLNELLLLLVNEGVVFDIDFDKLYRLYGFSPLFDTLLQKDVYYVREEDDAPHVLSWYDATLVKQTFTGLSRCCQEEKHFSDRCQVRALIQLSRDSARNSVIENLRHERRDKYASSIDKLPVPEYIKEILRFKWRIYP